jgi:DNA-directed RNA polymerase subunit RPC12/RpoP
MSIDFTCQKCEASFELDAQDLIEGTEKIVCPHCDAKAPTNLAEDFVAALTEMPSATGTASLSSMLPSGAPPAPPAMSRPWCIIR